MITYCKQINRVLLLAVFILLGTVSRANVPALECTGPTTDCCSSFNFNFSPNVVSVVPSGSGYLATVQFPVPYVIGAFPAPFSTQCRHFWVAGYKIEVSDITSGTVLHIANITSSNDPTPQFDFHLPAGCQGSNFKLSVCVTLRGGDPDPVFCNPTPQTITIQNPFANVNYSINESPGTCGQYSFSLQDVPIGPNGQWSFGDGTYATGNTASNTYPSNGTYTVTYTNDAIAPCVVVTTVNVTDYPQGDFTYSFPDPCDVNAGINININNYDAINNTYSGSINGVNFPVNAATGTIPANLGLIAGTNEIKLIITGPTGCITEIVKYVTFGNISADFTVANNGHFCEGDLLTFGGVTGGASSYIWTIEDASNTVLYTSPSSEYYPPQTVTTNPGSYTVTLVVTSQYPDPQNPNNTISCSDTHTETVEVHEQLDADFTWTTPAGGACGDIQLSLINTPSDLTSYSIDYGDGSPLVTTTSNTFNPVPHNYSNGTYPVTVTLYNEGCSATISHLIYINTSATAYITSATQNLCPGDNLTLNAVIANSNGNGGVNYAWQKDGNPFGGNTAQISITDAGVYTVTLTSTSSAICFDNNTATVNINLLGAPTATFVSAVASHCGNADGKVVLQLTDPLLASNGFLINGIPHTANPTTFEVTVENLAPGTQNLTITNALDPSCSGVVSVTVPDDSPVMSYTVTPETCLGSDGAITVTSTGGSGAYNYVIYQAASYPNIASSSNSTGIFSSLIAGQYVVTSSDENGCTSIENILVPNSGVQLSLLNNNLGICTGGSVTIDPQLVVTGTANTPVLYMWNNATGSYDISVSPTAITASGDYRAEVSDGVCTAELFFTVAELDPIQVYLELTDPNCPSETADVEAFASGGGGNYTYNWTGNVTGSGAIVTVSGLAGTSEQVSVNVEDAFGCVSTLPDASITINFVDAIELCTTGIGASDATISLAAGSTITPDPNYAASISISNCELNICASGGTEPYVFDWILQDAELVETTTITFSLVGNQVTYLVTDINNQPVEITTSDQVQYVDGNPITVVLSGTDQGFILANSPLLAPLTAPTNPADYVIFNSDDVNLGLSGTYKYPYWKIVKESNAGVWTTNYIIVPDLQSDGITPFTVDEETITYQDISVMTHASDITTGAAPATTSLDDEFVSGIYNLVITDANGCTQSFEDIDIQLPPTPDFPEFSFVWKKTDIPPIEEPEIVDVNLKDNMQEASNSLLSAVQECLQTQAQEMKANFETNCFDIETFRDEMTLSYPVNEHHYTLYYYDRAGQLTQTVPPQGVELLSDADVTDIIQYRKDGTAPTNYVPSHTMKTNYQYNSLGQLISQTTPDGGNTIFIYDSKNRLRFSQNDYQLAEGTFSYTKYDPLGRIVEVGQSEEVIPPPNPSPVGRISNANVDVPSFPVNDNSQITRTVYSTSAGVDYYGVPQHYLQNRVSYVYNDFDGDFNTPEDQYYTYYSYDAHGNVEWLIQEDPELGKNYIAYEYDLISGNVLKVRYNEHRADRFYHRYHYDAENRLTLVETSADDELWETDANYDYYAHGPLKRSVIGDNKVQGLDYIYTIHGWLKAVNSPHLAVNDDPGADGQNVAASWDNSIVAQDRFGMALGYYNGDYKSNTASYLTTDYSNLYASVNKDLYNGNISHWVQSQLDNGGTQGVIDARAGAYQYDVLNRIKQSTNFNRTGANNWTSLSNNYKTNYKYDANGNLMELDRYEEAGAHMDDLIYSYYEKDASGQVVNPGNGIEKINQLYSVTDNSGNTLNGRGDLEATHTYVYDEIGNLTNETAQERMDVGFGYQLYDVGTSITWTVYGKVKTVDKIVSLSGNRHSVQHIEFNYDASGNRIKKTVSRKDDNTGALNILGPIVYNPDEVTTTYYVRDAQGNILSVYDKTGEEDNSNTYTVSIQLKEQPIYGSDRVGQKTSMLELANATNVPGGGGTITFPPLPSGVETISEYQNWITSANRTGLLSANNNLCDCNIKELVSTGGSAYADAGTKTEFLGVAKNGVAVAEDLNGNLQFYVVLAEKYLGTKDACLVYDKDDQLMEGIELIGEVDVNSKPVITNIAGTNQYAIVTLSANQQPMYHVVDMNEQGYGTVNNAGKVMVANIPMSNYTSSGVIPTHGLHFTAFEDHINNKNVIYSTRYLPDPVLTNMGTTELVAYELSSANYSLTGGNSFLPAEYSLHTLSGCGNTRLGELQISPEGDQLLWYQYDKTVAGFDHRLADIYAFELDPTKTAFTGVMDVISPTAAGNYAGNVGEGRVEFADNNEDVLFSQRGLYLQGSLGNENEKNLWKYTKATTQIDPLNPASTYLFSEIRRGVDGNLYMPNMGEAYDQLHSYDGTTASSTAYADNGYQMASGLPTQVYKMYAQGSVGTTGTTGGVPTTLLASVGNKQYELKDHLGNVRVVISDLKVLNDVDGSNTINAGDYFSPDVLSFSDHYPFGSIMPGRNSNNGDYRYGFGGQEGDPEIKGQGNSYSYTFRMYDPRIGRWLSVDPVANKFPWYTPYQFAGNSPIRNVDLEGAEDLPNELYNRAKTYGINLVKKATNYVIQRTAQTLANYAEKKTEEKLDEMANSSDPLTASLGLTGEFITGLGPESRSFGPDDPFTKSLQESNITTEALESYYKGYQEYKSGDRNAPPSQYRVDFSPSPLPWHGDTGPVEEFATDGKFTAAQFTGTATYFFSLSEDGSMLNVQVYDTKTEYSFLYHAEGTDRHTRDQSSIMGETTQTYNFSISIDDVKQRVE